MIRESSNSGLDISEFHESHLWTVSCGVVYLRDFCVKGNVGRVLPKLQDTFVRTLTASPAPVNVDLQDGRDTSTIDNMGRDERWTNIWTSFKRSVPTNHVSETPRHIW